MAASKKTILMEMSNKKNQNDRKQNINPRKNHTKGKKRSYTKVYTDWANDDYTTYRDVDCWIRVLTLRLSLRP